MPSLQRAHHFCWLALLCLLVGCSNGRGSVNEPAAAAAPPAAPPPAAPPPAPGAQESFAIGGTVAGLAGGGGLVLQNNGGDDLSVAANGSFTFSSRLADRSSYTVTVRSHPVGQSCAVRNASGTIASASVTDVQVSCASGQFTIAGTVSGLAGSGLALQLGAETLAIVSNGSFSFASALASGTAYRVTVRSQPTNPAQVCTVAGGEGVVGTTNVTSVRVACASNTFSIGGTVSDLLGSGLVLQNNNGNSVSVESNGAFMFSTELASGATYNVTVRTQPSDPTQVCTVRNGRGTVGSADISNVTVTCNTSDFTIGGTVRDLAGSGLVLRNNGTDELTIDSSGTFSFDTGLPPGASYNVTVAEQPSNPTQTCNVSNGSGVVRSSDVTNITVQCTTQGFLVRGEVRNLRGSGLVLQNNGSDNLAIASNGRFEFSTPLPSGSPYNVTVLQQPRDPRQRCTVEHGAGTIRDSHIDNVDVRCRRGDNDDDDEDDGDD